MFNQNRIYRLFQLINFLKARPAKTVRSIETFLNTSERTVYRYLDLLKDLGFNIEKDSNNKIFIAVSSDIDLIPFTPQEADYLKRLILTVGKDNQLAQSILQKVEQSSEIQLVADSIFKAHLAKIVEQISVAIIEGKQLLIKGYSSANSQSISDRLVEPTCFTDNYDAVSAFEIKTSLNKYFNIERISSVEVLETSMKHEAQHEFHKPDIFGFQGKSMNKEIELKMNMRSYLVLKEEYPMSAAFIKPIPDTDKYYFKANVQSFQAPGRFVLGFLEEVEVLGSKEFVRYIQRIVQRNT
ncbi:MAG: WYL domain-containing protein [Crocinitomicaceae bacterium]|nr:WYL domain-containing protein [Crocinitomicaceae bacterium]